MAVLTAICLAEGATVPSGCPITFVGQGLEPEANAAVYMLTADPDRDRSIGGGLTDSLGNFLLNVTSLAAPAGNGVGTMVLHQPVGQSKDLRVSNFVDTGWSGSGPCPVIAPSSPVLTAALNTDDSVTLAWSASTVCNPTIGHVEYEVLRGTTSPPTTPITPKMTARSYHDTPPVGVPVFYRIRATWAFSPTLGGIGVASLSNIVSPSIYHESWGMIAA